MSSVSDGIALGPDAGMEKLWRQIMALEQEVRLLRLWMELLVPNSSRLLDDLVRTARQELLDRSRRAQE